MAFIGYAVAKGLYPVLILHVVLLPLNCVRLAQLCAVTKRPKRRTVTEDAFRPPDVSCPQSISDHTLSGG
jgi:hypothetical protein